MRLKQPQKQIKESKVEDILDWVDKMGQGHSDKNNDSLDENAERKEEKRLFYLGVKRRRTKSPLKEQKVESLKPCKNTGLEKITKKDEKIDAPSLKEYAKNSEIHAFFKLFGKQKLSL